MCADFYDGGTKAAVSSAVSSSAQGASQSSSPFLASTSPGTDTSTLPLNEAFLESAEVTVGEYGTSPPFRIATPTSFANSESEEVFYQEGSSAGDMNRNPLRKCMSESFANPVSELSADAMYSTQTPAARMTQKKIHIPVKESKNYISTTWHGAMEQRPSSAATENIVSTAKGHKRSQSDMGVGAGKNSAFSLMADASSYCEGRTHPVNFTAAASEPGNALPRDQRGKQDSFWKIM